jgi:hypothetical protein
MTILEHKLLAPPDARPDATPLVTRWLEISWSALRRDIRQGARPTAFKTSRVVLSIELLDGHRAMIEAWFEADGAQRTVHQRAMAKATISHRDGLLQIDSDPLCRLSMRIDAGDDGQIALLYAHAPLLAGLNMVPGSFNAPAARLSVSQASAR